MASTSMLSKENSHSSPPHASMNDQDNSRNRYFMCSIYNYRVAENTSIPLPVENDAEVKQFPRRLRDSTEMGFKKSESDRMHKAIEPLKSGEAMAGSIIKITKENVMNGRGVIALKYLRKHTFLGIYPGILLPAIIADQREIEYETIFKDVESCYTFFFKANVTQSLRSYLSYRFSSEPSLGTIAHLAFDGHPQIVDYDNHKNAMGIMNHSLKLRNVSSHVVNLPDEMPVIAFFTCRDVAESQELLWDYNDKKNTKNNPWLKH